MNAMMQRKIKEFVFQDEQYGAVRVSECGLHVHLDSETAEKLGFEKPKMSRALLIEGEFVTEPRVTLLLKDGTPFRNIATLYEWRPKGQIEVTPAIFREITGHECTRRRASGDLGEAPLAKVLGPNGNISEIPIIVPEFHGHSGDKALEGKRIDMKFPSGIEIHDIPIKHNNLLCSEGLVIHPCSDQFSPLLRQTTELVEVKPPDERLIQKRKVILRTGTPSDIEKWRAFHEDVSPESEWKRFHQAIPKKTLQDYRRLARRCIETENTIAFIVLDDRGRILGIGRLEKKTGEVSFLIADQWQGNGIGTILMGEIRQYARNFLIRGLWGSTELYNMGMRRLFDKFSFAIKSDFEESVCVATLDLQS